MPKPHLLCDLDGTIADFVTHFLHHFHVDHNRFMKSWPVGQYSMDPWFSSLAGISLAEAIDGLPDRFWTEMPEYTWTTKILQELGTYGVTFVSIAGNDRAVRGKAAWIDLHVPRSLTWNFIPVASAAEKIRLAQDHTVLLDDREDTVMHFRRHGHRAVLMPARWNSASESPTMTDISSLIEEVRSEFSAIATCTRGTHQGEPVPAGLRDPTMEMSE